MPVVRLHSQPTCCLPDEALLNKQPLITVTAQQQSPDISTIQTYVKKLLTVLFKTVCSVKVNVYNTFCYFCVIDKGSLSKFMSLKMMYYRLTKIHETKLTNNKVKKVSM